MNENMSLLSQNEVDTLISFMREKQGDEINGSVLSQNSVDKLISLLENVSSKDGIRLNSSAITAGTTSIIAAGKSLQKGKYDLTFKCDDKGQIMLYACSEEGDDPVAITPQTVTEHPNAKAPKTWGCCIMPAAFVQVARELGISYSEETLEEVKRIFAEKMYGSPDSPIPTVYL